VNRDRDRELYYAALHHFGNWRSALTAAGINVSDIARRKPRHLDRDSMLLWLRNRNACGKSTVYWEVCLENREYALAIRREFGSWVKAIGEALREGDTRL
jgi:hypothetical protein